MSPTAGADARETPEVRHDIAGRRFVAVVDDHAGYVEYQRDGNVLVITHTVVPPEIGGRGIAGRLVKAAVEFARVEGSKVRPRCSYAEAWLERHPEYADLKT